MLIASEGIPPAGSAPKPCAAWLVYPGVGVGVLGSIPGWVLLSVAFAILVIIRLVLNLATKCQEPLDQGRWSGGAGTPDFVRTACHPPQRHPGWTATPPLLRQVSGEGLSRPLESTAPHGAGGTCARANF